MPQDLGVDFSGGLVGWTHALFGTDITTGNSRASNTISLGAATAAEFGFEFKIVGGTGTVNGTVTIRLQRSRDNTDFGDIARSPIIAVFAPIASTTITLCPHIAITARYNKVVIDNASGISVTSSSTADYELIYGDQA